MTAPVVYGFGFDPRNGGFEAILIDGVSYPAQAVAAFPDLLEALKEARSQLEAYELERSGEAYNSLQINAAIALATGASQ
uniref:Uncharacterized protein n=1 Tax=viral metagenome TaxID=1070528 RepID=A0A6M3LN85_9ZZZZ